MLYNEKLVEFHEYCPKCIYYERDANEDPCFDCLGDPVNTHSHKPTKFSPDTTKVVSRKKQGL